eukprot:TRINITY_DN16437_c0_g1_i1.p1 TRINITY_DN16437_c0_g1~~TRINITY_DN16437_c0_g1_i1.p1  ORF type:complete len:242 (+),score=28.25 TRINITY_DN16437_c0_g1_i1:79-804(+)
MTPVVICFFYFFFLMIRRPPRSTHCISSAASDVYKRQYQRRVHGMWAFVIYNRVKKSIFGARDRFGVKPFYYELTEDRLIFASEIPALLSVKNSRPKPNRQVIFDYLVFNRTDQTEDTFFEGIKKLQHGHSFTIDFDVQTTDVKFQIKRWYNLKERLGSPFRSSQEFREIFSSAIELRLRSDVAVGVCLSGGLDSSAEKKKKKKKKVPPVETIIYKKKKHRKKQKVKNLRDVAYVQKSKIR